MDNKDANGFIIKSINGLESPKLEDRIEDEESESKSLLPPRKDEMSRKSDRKVQWNDRHGNQLAQVLEFVPSDVSDTDDDDSDVCICKIM